MFKLPEWECIGPRKSVQAWLELHSSVTPTTIYSALGRAERQPGDRQPLESRIKGGKGAVVIFDQETGRFKARLNP